ncbi:MAG: alginate export family protein [Alphaproteobacteria bacterium]|nr:alginate export family protein [Alphaproteobacteria bacterium]
MLSLAAPRAAELETSVHAQVRPRAEPHTGRDLAPGGATNLFSQRARLGATLTLGGWSTLIEVQDVRVWGTEVNTLTDFSADTFDLHQGYAAWKGERGWLRLGRQEINMHEQRLIGAVDWTQQGRAFDGFHGQAHSETFGVNVAGAILASQGLEDRGGDAGMVAAWGGYRPSEGEALVDLVAIFMFDAMDGSTLTTAGLYAKGGAGILSGRVEGYAQLGGPSVQWMAGAQGTLAPELGVKPTVTLWYDALSGGGADGGGFNTLFATNHKFYGLADIAWFKVGAAQDGRGLQDAALKLGLSPTEGTKVGLDGHLFLGTASVDGLSAVVGEEVDLTGKVKLGQKVWLAGGGALYHAPDGEAIDGWGFLQVDAKL